MGAKQIYWPTVVQYHSRIIHATNPAIFRRTDVRTRMKSGMKRRVGKSRKSGFTLLELMIVIVILGVLVGIILANFQSSMIRSRDAQRKSDLRQIAEAIELYYSDRTNQWFKFPRPDANGEGKIRGCGEDADTDTCDWGDVFSNTTTEPDTIYMIRLPADPREAMQYFYTSDGLEYYQIYARLENTEDKDLIKDADGDIQSYENTNCGNDGTNTLECNYGFSSANISLEHTGEGRLLHDDPVLNN